MLRKVEVAAGTQGAPGTTAQIAPQAGSDRNSKPAVTANSYDTSQPEWLGSMIWADADKKWGYRKLAARNKKPSRLSTEGLIA
jgi:hypothetical protein